jgi:hypothetical protein
MSLTHKRGDQMMTLIFIRVPIEKKLERIRNLTSPAKRLHPPVISVQPRLKRGIMLVVKL